MTKLRCAGRTDPGRIRRNNEDAFYIDRDRGIFLVVDGIGGQAAGEKAAEIAVERIRARLERQTGATEQRVREAIALANNEILRAANANPAWSGMACVLTVAVLENGSAVIGHVGDSRLYEIRRGEIRKITHDHSPIGEREDSQELSEAEAMRHPRRNEVFRDVGSEEHAPDDPDFIEIRRIAFEPDGALLLCSDGLSDQVGSAEIQHAVERHAGDPDAAVRELIDAANRAGGKDNVTVLIVEGEQFTTPKPASTVAVRRSNPLASRPAMLLYGMLLAGVAGWFARPYLIPPPAALAPRVLTAGTGGDYNTITQAIAEARPGDTVEILSGEYHEQIQLKSGVAIRSHLPREARLLAPAVSSGPAIAADDVHDASVSGILVVGDAQAPLSAGILLNNSQVEIANVEIEGANIGIEIRGAGSPVIAGNSIHDCLREGLLIEGASSPWVSHNSFLRNKGAAIAARDGAKPQLTGNIFDHNTLELPSEISSDTLREHNFLLDAKPVQRGGKKK
jgi:serine/threonine protein phosphatase PrpC